MTNIHFMEANVLPPENLEIKTVRNIWSMQWLKLCLFFFIGFLAGFIIFSSSNGIKKTAKTPIPDKQETVTGSEQIDSLQLADALHYDSPLVKAACKVRYSAKIVEISVDLTSLYPVKSLVEFDVNNLNILNIRHVSVNDQSTIMAAANFVQFNSVGDNKFIILLSNRNMLPHQIDFAISQNDLLIYQNSVSINKD